jgi:hypothetical protein
MELKPIYITKLEVPTNKSFQETLGFLKTILVRYYHEAKHIIILVIFVATLVYNFK